MEKEAKRLAVMTLGCKVNQYETQALKERFRDLGYMIVDEDQFAEIYVINTCTVTGLSDKKSRQYIRRAKRINPEAVTVVAGCYAQVSPDEAAGIEGVDIVCGTNEKTRLPQYVDEFLKTRQKIRRVRPFESLTEYEESGIITSMESRTRAFIKIQEGCDRFCSYCIIPYARGAVRSRKRADIISEAEHLISKGFRELVLTGINTALYISENGTPGLYDIIGAIDGLPGDFRIRLGSLEPTVIDADYVERLLGFEKLCPHMHLSLQSGSDSVLERMNRHYSVADYKRIVEILRSHDAGYGITTDIITGFPGETDEEFEATKEVIKEIRFSKVHVFKYSKRGGTKAAVMPGQISSQIKAERSAELINLSDKAAAAFFDSLSGTVRQVLFEEFDPTGRGYEGFSDNYIKIHAKAADQDGGRLLNRFADVRLEAAYNDGMTGRIESNK